ncbi:MAG TPA: hypothetical protein VFD92_02965 [Candidatus Binatia bacterium]|nr:hypothetical protein [Candidatus Binatia bacterium]
MTTETTIRQLLARENRDPQEVAAALKFCLRTMRKLAHGKRNQTRIYALCRAHGIDPFPTRTIAA